MKKGLGWIKGELRGGKILVLPPYFYDMLEMHVREDFTNEEWEQIHREPKLNL